MQNNNNNRRTSRNQAIASKQDKIIFILKEVLGKIHKLEQQPSLSGMKSVYFDRQSKQRNAKPRKSHAPTQA